VPYGEELSGFGLSSFCLRENVPLYTSCGSLDMYNRRSVAWSIAKI